MPVWGRVLASVASMAATLLVSVQAAQAATCVGTLTDCDADGIPNDVDPCPGKPGNSGAWHGGFQDVDCWLPLLEFKDAPVAPFDPLCVPVAARPIRDLIPVDATKPSLGTKAVDGVMFVGVYSGSAGVAGALPADVAAGMAIGKTPTNAIFSCIAGVPRTPATGYLDAQSLVAVYGHRLAASYTRALLEGMPDGKYVPDGFGLLREVRTGSETFYDSMVGTNGTWFASPKAGYTMGLNGYLLVPGSLLGKDALPEPQGEVIDAECYATYQDYVETKLPPIQTPIDPWKLGSYHAWQPGDPMDPTNWATTPSGKVAAKRATPFGYRPFDAGIFTELQPLSAPANPVALSLTFNVQQITSPTVIGKGNWKDTPTKFPPACGSFGSVPVDVGSITSPKSCSCFSTALTYHKLPQSPQQPPIVNSKQPYKSWEEFFQDGTPSPTTEWRYLDDLFVLVGGDKFLISTAVPWVEPSAVKPEWNMRSPLYQGTKSYPSGVAIGLLPIATAPYPYKAGFLTITSATDDWPMATGTWFAALRAHLEAPVVPGGCATCATPWRRPTATWSWTEGTRVGYAARVGTTSKLVADGAGTQAYHSYPAGAVDYVETVIDKSLASTIESTPFATADTTVASVHVRAEKWHPGDDLWFSNYDPASVGSSKVAPGWTQRYKGAKANLAASQWLPENNLASVPELSSWNARISLCDVDHYDPWTEDGHWPRIATQKPLAGLFGRRAEVKTAYPKVYFPGSDMVHTPFSISDMVTPGLHVGLDINYHVEKNRDIDPAYRGLFGVGPSDDQFCFGTPAFILDYVSSSIAELKVAIPCEHELIKHCEKGGELDDTGCNPAERIRAEFKASCTAPMCKQCTSWGPFNFICSWVACGLEVISVGSSCIYASGKAALDLADSYVWGQACFFSQKVQCSNDHMILYKKPADAEQEIDLEIEHAITFNSPFISETECWDNTMVTGECTRKNYIKRNMITYAAPGPAGGAIAVTTEDEPMSPSGAFNSTLGVSENVYPFTLLPGFVGDGFATFGRVANVYGEIPAGSAPPSTRILPDPIVSQLLAKPFGKDAGFRAEFLGDVVIDCGHMPLHPEIHPPSNIVLHASPPVDVQGWDPQARRYSIFAMNRKAGSPPSAPFDLWPGPRAPGKTTLRFDVLFPVAQSPAAFGLNCSAFPSESPNRMRCVLNANDSSDGCTDGSARFRPNCVGGRGGGLVEVGWQ